MKTGPENLTGTAESERTKFVYSRKLLLQYRNSNARLRADVAERINEILSDSSENSQSKATKVAKPTV